MSTAKPAPPPVEVALSLVTERELYALVLDVIERRCSSRCLDDDTDARAVAETIAAALASRGVRL